MQNTLLTTAALLGALANTAQATPAPFHKRDVLTALDESAHDTDLQFQPLLDFDTDGCYNTAAIDPDGNVNPGLAATGTPEGNCRDEHQLENSNVYSRRRCNNGICAIMYEYYFEKDQAVHGSFLGGHRHDWENVVVFASDDDSGDVLRVAPSCHGGYPDATNDFPADDSHPLIVYHKDGAGTHCFRLANDDDQEEIENHFGEWYRSPVLSWELWPTDDLRNIMLDEWDGGIGPKLPEEKFGDSLADAAGDEFPDFDPHNDE